MTLLHGFWKMFDVKRRILISWICLSCLGLVFFLALNSCQNASGTLVILHTNDTHGSFQPRKLLDDDRVRLIGGMEITSHYINHIRAQEENVLLIDSGDIMTGTLASEIEYNGVLGGAMAEFLNLMEYDVRSYGNHAFDLGQENAKAIAALSKFPVLMANIVYEETGELFSDSAYHFLEKGGIRVGFIAVMEEYFLTEVHKRNTVGLAVLPIVSTLQSYMPEIQKKSDLIIAMVHSNFKDGERVAREVPEVDIVLVAAEDGRFKEINGTLVKSTYGHQRTLGYIKLELKKGKIVDYQQELIWLWADVDMNASPAIPALVQDIEQAIEEEFTQAIGKSDFNYKCPGYDSVENALGNWITDVMRWKTGCQIGMQNSGGIRADIYAGPISKKDVYEVSPFSNMMVEFKLSGKQLKEILERDVERGRDRLQFSGLIYSYFPKSVQPYGKRIHSIKVDKDVIVEDGVVLLPDNFYTVVSNDYVTSQAEEKYFGFALEECRNTGYGLTQVLAEWLEKNQLLVCSIEDRIVELKANLEPAP